MTKEEVIQIATREALKIFNEQNKHQNENKLKKTKKILEAYRKVKASIENNEVITKEEKAELRWKFIEDLLGNVNSLCDKSESIIRDIELKRSKNRYCVHCVDEAIRLYEQDCKSINKPEEERRLRILKNYYIDESPLDISDLAEKENISEKTVYKDLNKACNVLSIYILGI